MGYDPPVIYTASNASARSEFVNPFAGLIKSSSGGASSAEISAALERSTSALSAAADAKSTANAAKSTADGLASQITTAASKADTAKTTADNAASAVAGAVTAAGTASGKADAAKSAADGVVTGLGTLTGRVDGISTLLGQVKTTADTATSGLGTVNGRVDTLNTLTGQIKTTADNAATLAGTASTKADGAKTSADGAATLAGQAKSTADGLSALVTQTKNTADGAAASLTTLTGKVDALPVFFKDSEGFKATFQNANYLLNGQASGGGTGGNTGGGTVDPNVSLLPGLLYRLNPNAPRITNSAYDVPAPEGTAAIHVSPDGGVYDMVEEISKVHFDHGSGALTWKAGLSPAGGAVFDDAADSYNDAWDGARLPVREADKTFINTNPTMTMIHVWKQRLGPSDSGNILKVMGNANLVIQGINGSDGRLYMGQSNGSINGIEDPSKVPAFGVWHVMVQVVRDNTFYSFRNEKLALKTIPGNGTPLGGISATEFCFMNNPQAMVADLYFSNAAPTRAVLNAELQRLAALHNIPNVGTISSADYPDAGVDAPAALEPRAVETWMTTPNYPVNNVLMSTPGDVPGDGLTLENGATNYISMRFSNISGNQNLFTEQDLHDKFFFHSNFGNPNSLFDTIVASGTGSPPFPGRARYYPPNDPKSLHKIDPVNGLQLGIRPTNDGKDINLLEAGWARLPADFRPGMCMEVIYQSASHRRAWTPIWFMSSRGWSPGKGGDIFANGVNGKDSFLYYSEHTHGIELDWDDMFGQEGSGIRKGNGILFNSPLQDYAVPFAIPPYHVWTRSGGTKGYGLGGYTEMVTTSNFNRADNPTRLLFNWRNDGTNIIDMFENGLLIQQLYIDYSYASDIIEPDGSTKKCPMHVIFNNQGPPTFEPSYNARTAAEFTGWNHITRIHSFKAWHGNVVVTEAMKN